AGSPGLVGPCRAGRTCRSRRRSRPVQRPGAPVVRADAAGCRAVRWRRRQRLADRVGLATGSGVGWRGPVRRPDAGHARTGTAGFRTVVRAGQAVAGRDARGGAVVAADADVRLRARTPAALAATGAGDGRLPAVHAGL